jgi:sterol desaturase/sphingolipid hydroxylase (fatty acid hydroxylase superfamily)
MITGAVMAGAAGWSFSEYALHRWVGHDPKSASQFADEHRRHHAARFYFAPTAKKVAYVAPILAGAAALAGLAAGRRGVAFVAGYAAAYTGYEVLHRRLHTHAPQGAVGRFLRRHHFAHHFNGPQTNHGVTSPVWDVAFGTLRDPGVIRVPEKLAMSWLVDPATGDARPEYAADYVIHHPKRRRDAGAPPATA